MTIFTIIVFVLTLSLLVFVHEFGHFIVAKRAGAKVEEFGFGFPPRAWGVKRGDTVYSINWIPLGGFVKIKGEDGGGQSERDSFSSKGIPTRLAIVLAGVAMNVVLTFALLSAGAMIGAPQEVDPENTLAKVRNEGIQIVSVLPDSPADKSGVAFGDIVLQVDGVAWDNVDDLRDYISSHGEVELKLKRGESEELKNIKTEFLQIAGRNGIGVGLIKAGIVSYPWYIAPWVGLKETWFYIREITLAFARIISDLFVGAPVSVDLSGPVGIAVLTGRMARLGIAHFIQFVAFLSINLAFINVFPFPALDGGRALFLAIEGARRKPVSPKIEAMIHNIGFVILMALVVIITYRDIARYGSGFISKLIN